MKLAVGALVLAWAATAFADSSVPQRRRGGGTFCEFEVFRAEDHAPMSGVKYRVTLPDGSVRRGKVPKSGLVHIDVPDAGECSIDLDLPPGMRIAD